jgi:hypothetical protein
MTTGIGRWAQILAALALLVPASFWAIKRASSPPSSYSRSTSSFGYGHVQGGFCVLEESQGKPVFLLISMQPRDKLGIQTEKGAHLGIAYEIVSLKPNPGSRTDVTLGRVPTIIVVTPSGEVVFGQNPVESGDFERLTQFFSIAYEGVGPHNAHEFGTKPTINAIHRFFFNDGNRKWPQEVIQAVETTAKELSVTSPQPADRTNDEAIPHVFVPSRESPENSCSWILRDG